MALIVQKYGGTSVGSVDRILNVAQRIKKTCEAGNQVVAVVSAMGGVTDKLIGLANEINQNPAERELDVLLATGEQQSIALVSMALHSLGIDAVSCTGRQAGVVTIGSHTKGKIDKIEANYVKDNLNAGRVVIVAGFQGVREDGLIHTLGRGGSDLSAIAIAHAVGADLCQILTDVDGVYTCDPRVVKDAKKINTISYDEMLELASSGAKVMQSRSVEFASKYGVVFEVRSSLNDNPGTIVCAENDSMETVVIRGVSIERNQARITVTGIPDKPGNSAQIFTALSEAEVNVDMIVSNNTHEGLARHSFTVSDSDLAKALASIQGLLPDISSEAEVLTEAGMAKLSVVGIGMKSHSGVAAKMFDVLGKAGINIGLITTSEIKISVSLDAAKADLAANVIHEAFDLKS